MANYQQGGYYGGYPHQNFGNPGDGMSEEKRKKDRNRRRRKPGANNPGEALDDFQDEDSRESFGGDYVTAAASPRGSDEMPSVSPRKKRNRQPNRNQSWGSQENDPLDCPLSPARGSTSQGSPAHEYRRGGAVTYSDVKNGTYQNVGQDFPPNRGSCDNPPVYSKTYYSQSPTRTRVFVNRDHSPRTDQYSSRGASPMRSGSPHNSGNTQRQYNNPHGSNRRDESPGNFRSNNPRHYNRNDYNQYSNEQPSRNSGSFQGGGDDEADPFDKWRNRAPPPQKTDGRRSRSPGMQQMHQRQQGRAQQNRGQNQAPNQGQGYPRSMPAAQRFQSPKYQRGCRPIPKQPVMQQQQAPQQQQQQPQQKQQQQQGYNPYLAHQMAYGMMASMYNPYLAQSMCMQAFQGTPIIPGQNPYAGSEFYKRPPFNPDAASTQAEPPSGPGPGHGQGLALPWPGHGAPSAGDDDNYDVEEEDEEYSDDERETPPDRGQPKSRQHHQHHHQQQQGSGMNQQQSGPSQQQGRPVAGRGGDGGRNNNRNNQQRPQQRKDVFEPYWDPGQVSEGLKRGTLIQGDFRVNPKNYEHCYVAHPDGHSDIFICGLKERNRALNGDVVAVFMHPRPQWKVLVEDLELMEETLEERLLDMSMQENPRDTEENSGNEEQDDAKHQTEEDGAVGNDDTSDGHKSHSPISKTDEHSKKDTGSNNSSAQPQSVKSKDSAKSKQSLSRVEELRQNAERKKSWTPNKHYTSLEDIVRAPHRSNSSVIRRLFGREAAEAAVASSSSQDGSVYSDEDEEEMERKMDAVPDSVLLRTGKVVYIVERKNNRSSVGTIKLMNDRNRHTALFCPSDHRMPRIMIPMSDCPKEFYQRPADYASTLFIARVTEWADNSQFAKGCLARSLGEAGEIEPETEGMLVDYDIDSTEFSQEVLDCLPKNLPWQIPEAEYAYRRDLRKHCVFTIDPATARDLDDALHIISLGDGFYEVGVHIADVSYFVEENTMLDEVAASRSTSVYLVQKVIPMLPRLLCEELCSLNPDKDRLTFSVIWKLTDTGEIVDEWFGRTVIRSCVKLAYEHAQGFIEHPGREWTTDELPKISEGFKLSQIRESVLSLNKVALQLRKHRFDKGALRLDQVKIQFALDRDSGMPNGYSVYEQKDSNRLIEEFMLLANMAVAHKIYKTYPETACLRRHPPPQTRMITELVELCSSLGIEIDASSAGALQRSLSRHMGKDIDSRARMQILTSLCSKPMQNARYFCTGTISDEAEYRHYALNVPLYTHFTSPIRRYPDCMVHRLLAAALGYCGPPKITTMEVKKQTEHCNDKKISSKRVQEQSNDLFFSIFVRECGPLREVGMVMGVLDKSFQVLILKLGVIKQVYCEQLPLSSFKFLRHGKKPQLTLIWNTDTDHPKPVLQSITIFTRVNCVLVGDNRPLKYNALILHPNDPLKPK